MSSSSSSYIPLEFSAPIPVGTALNNARAGDASTTVAIQYTTNKPYQISVTLQDNAWVMIDSISYDSQTIYIRAKPATSGSGIASVAVQFQATDGVQTKTSGGNLEVRASLNYKLSLNVFNFSTVAGDVNLKLVNDGKAILDSSGVLATDQKVAAKLQLQSNIGGFPYTSDLEIAYRAKVAELVDGSSDNISVPYGASVTWTHGLTLYQNRILTLDGGLGFSGMWRGGQQAEYRQSVFTEAAWGTRNVFIKPKAELINSWQGSNHETGTTLSLTLGFRY